MMKKGRTTSSSMQYVFDDVLLKILIIIVSRSLKDFFSVNLVSKKFKEIAEDPRIYQHINITDFEIVNPLGSWGASNKVSTFINHCIQCRNPDALYMVGLHYFFRDNKEEAGIQQLKSAISEGYQVATYVYDVILVCPEWDSKHERLKLLYSLNRHNSGGLSVRECRDMFQLCLSGFWMHREVKAQILKLHHDNATIKPRSDCGSPQGPITLRTHWDECDHKKFTIVIKVLKDAKR